MLATPRQRPLDLDLSQVPKWPSKSKALSATRMIPTMSRFELRTGEAIGSGGFGTVYEAELENRKVALKKLRVNMKNEEVVWGSFLSELRGVCLKHPNIVEMLGAVMYENAPCLVMEYAGDRNLQEVIDDRVEDLPLLRRIRIAHSVVSGMEYIHDLEITHLDLKPANMIMKDADSCKIGDFGCSLKVNEFDGGMRPSIYLTGTHAYKAPELLLGEFPTVQADVYSLGVCMWQMLAREEPYKDEDPQLVIFGIATDSIRPRLPSVVSNTDAGYLELFQKCWSGSPKDRPTASVLRANLSSNIEQNC